MTIEEWKEKCSNMGLTAQEIAELSGVSVDIVRAVIWGTQIPKFAVWEKLDEALKHNANMIGEPPVPYLNERNYASRGKSYTSKDYYAIPDGIRVELIDGKIYDLSAPSLIHQRIMGEVYFVLEKYIKEHKGKCVTFFSPLDVKVDCDENTIVQPDVFVICNRDKLTPQFVYGAPDLVIEVLSPSTKYKDEGIKFNKYRSAGVREYWLVDAKKKTVVVHKFVENVTSKIYSFDSKVPVGIFDDKCEVDFSEIHERIKELMK